MTGQEVGFCYPFNITLAASATATNDGKRTDTDSDFLLYGVLIQATSNLFLVQFADANQNVFSSDPVAGFAYFGQGPLPYMFIGEPRVFPPGSQIGVPFIQDTSGFQNIIQIAFVGKKRFLERQAICEPVRYR